MREDTSFKFEWLIKTGALFFGALLVVLSVSSIRLISNTKGYLENEVNQRLLNLSDIISREIHDRYDQFLSDPYYLYAITVRESLADLVVLDRGGRVLIDSRGSLKKGAPYRLAVALPELEAAYQGTVRLSPIYHKGGRTLCSAYFPIKNMQGAVASVGEVTLDAGYIEDLTEQGTTYFFLKSMSVVFLLAAAIYVARTLLRSQRSLVQAARGAGVGGGDVSFVVDTFHSVVASLKEKERELKELKERAEEKAQRIESYNENVLRSIQSGVMTFDRDGRAITVNESSGAILGRDVISLHGRTSEEIFGRGSWVAALIGKTLASGRPEKRGEGEATAADGSVKWLGAGTSPLVSRDGLIGVILVFTDITEVKELRDRMELKERIALMGEMSAGLAHELRNPMGVISGYADFLARRLSEDAPSHEAVQSILSEIRGMDDIIREFMNFSQPTELNITESDIGTLIEESFKALPAAGDGVRRDVNIAEGLPPVEGDAVLLRQAFINIVKNSFEAMPDGGTLGIRAFLLRAGGPGADGVTSLPGGRYIKVEFSDTGCGIDEKDLSRIFTPFFTTKPRGTGLGLALVQKIIVYHGGRATVKSQKGTGTTFSVYIPAKSSEKEGDIPLSRPVERVTPSPSEGGGAKGRGDSSKEGDMGAV